MRKSLSDWTPSTELKPRTPCPENVIAVNQLGLDRQSYDGYHGRQIPDTSTTLFTLHRCPASEWMSFVSFGVSSA